jgi:hypothetical protein
MKGWVPPLQPERKNVVVVILMKMTNYSCCARHNIPNYQGTLEWRR